MAVAAEPRCTIVIATRNRRLTLLDTLRQLRDDHPAVPVVVVDNGSDDASAPAVRAAFPQARVVALAANCGAAARNVGAEIAATPYVAFNDDDTHWGRGSLERAADLLDAHAGVAALCANVRVLPEASVDAACALMAASALEKRSKCPGTAIASFLAGATVVRRNAFLSAGGFHPRFFIGAEEPLLSIDLMAAGWELVYDEHLLVYHAPSPKERDSSLRRRLVTRNRLWTSWLRASLPVAAKHTLRVALGAARDRDVRRAMRDAIGGIGWIVRERRAMPPAIERRYAILSER